MSDILAPAPVAGEGQAAPAPEGTTIAAPTSAEGQASDAKAEGTPAKAPEAQESDSFYDPKDLPEELKGHYKSMQSAFTKKMTGLSEREKANRQKLEAYDAFMRDPISAMQQTASRYGFRLTRAEAAAELARQGTPQEEKPVFSGPDGTPSSWEEIVQVAEERGAKRAREMIMQELGPYIDTVKSQTAVNIEREFDQLDVASGFPAGSWRQYEGQMVEVLKKHPSLSDDPATLYRLALPEEVYTSQATQKALSKLDKKVQNAQISAKGSIPKAVPTGREVKSFGDAVEAARAQLARQA